MVNDYDLGDNLGRYRNGSYARHLLFGLPALVDAGIRVRLTGDGGHRPLLRRRAVRTVLSNLRTLWTARDADVVYSASSYGALLAGAVPRSWRRYRVITVIHGVAQVLLRHPRLFAFVWRGHDELLFMSADNMSRLAGSLSPEQRVAVARWGPEPRPAGEEVDDTVLRAALALPTVPFALSLGKSKRDWTCLDQAQRATTFELVVVAADDCPLTDAPARTLLRPVGSAAFALSDDELRGVYAAADLVVLPLLQDDSLAGLTSLLEALGVRRRVVVSETLGLTGIERQYPGWVRTVPVGDAAALGAAVTELLETPPPVDPPLVHDILDFEQQLLSAIGRAGHLPH